MLVFQHGIKREPIFPMADSLLIEEERLALDEAIMGLKLKHREVIVYYYLEGCTTALKVLIS